jgi:hypothetical protein
MPIRRFAPRRPVTRNVGRIALVSRSYRRCDARLHACFATFELREVRDAIHRALSGPSLEADASSLMPRRFLWLRFFTRTTFLRLCSCPRLHQHFGRLAWTQVMGVSRGVRLGRSRDLRSAGAVGVDQPLETGIRGRWRCSGAVRHVSWPRQWTMPSSWGHLPCALGDLVSVRKAPQVGRMVHRRVGCAGGRSSSVVASFAD